MCECLCNYHLSNDACVSDLCKLGLKGKVFMLTKLTKSPMY